MSFPLIYIDVYKRQILKSSVIGAFQKLDPRYMLKNPVMFVVEVGFLITLVLCFVPNLFGDVQALAGKLPAASLRTYNVIVTLILFITVLLDVYKRQGYRGVRWIYTPADGKAEKPCLIFIHGGGFFGGDTLTVENQCKRFAELADAVVISVDYPL